MIAFCQHAAAPVKKITAALNEYAAPLFDLATRLYISKVFFSSGLTRFHDWQTGNFSTQIFLFTEEHPVPILPPAASAYITTAGELILPVLVAFGLMGRLGALGMLAMAAVIELTYLHATEHIFWMFLAASIIVRGPGKLSLDHLLMKRYDKA